MSGVTVRVTVSPSSAQVLSTVTLPLTLFLMVTVSAGMAPPPPPPPPPTPPEGAVYLLQPMAKGDRLVTVKRIPSSPLSGMMRSVSPIVWPSMFVVNMWMTVKV